MIFFFFPLNIRFSIKCGSDGTQQSKLSRDRVQLRSKWFHLFLNNYYRKICCQVSAETHKAKRQQHLHRLTVLLQTCDTFNVTLKVIPGTCWFRNTKTNSGFVTLCVCFFFNFYSMLQIHLIYLKDRQQKKLGVWLSNSVSNLINEVDPFLHPTWNLNN